MKHTLLAVVLLALACAGAGGGPVAAQAELTPDEMRAATVAAFDSGDFARAEAYARALLLRDPQDRVALGVIAQLALGAGDHEATRAAALAIWRSGAGRDDRYQAARLIAWSDLQAGHLTRARLWLRRALLVAPDATAAAATAADYRALRDEDPLSFRFDLGVNPSDNATGGTDVDLIRVNGVPLMFGPLPLSPDPVDRAWSGVALSPSFTLSYRLHESPAARSRVWLAGQGRWVVLSPEARAALEGVQYQGVPIADRHFSYWQATAGIEHEMARADGALTLGADLGRVWQRGEPSEDIAGLSLDRRWQIGEDGIFALGARIEYHLAASGGDSDSQRATLSAQHMITTAGGWGLRSDLALTHAASATANAVFDRVSLALAATPPAFLPGIDLSARLSATVTLYPDYRFFEPVPGGREDRRLALGVDVGLPRMSWAGFSPAIEIEAHRTTSNVNQYETGGVTVNLALRSNF
ncbi:MAG: hypothetical protein IT542_00460 [Rubellimicrobium sp.]|nr:hypothetical protein [Rubellimicrobium sp.]